MVIRTFPGHDVKNPPGVVEYNTKPPPQREGVNVSYSALLRALVKELDALRVFPVGAGDRWLVHDVDAVKKVLDKYRNFC